MAWPFLEIILRTEISNMFSNTILDAMATFGYFAAAVGVMMCIVAYYAIPKLIKSVFKDGEE